MGASAEHLTAAEAARRLGTSAKALRIYEQHGLLSPLRTSAGWRAYGPREMGRAAQIVSLRGLGLTIAAIARVLNGEPGDLEPALAAQQASLEARIIQLSAAAANIRAVRAGLADGETPTSRALAALMEPPGIAFDLPFPWAGERFETPALGPVTYVTGPLGSGKTRFAQCLAQALPGATFLGLDRAEAAQGERDADPLLASRVSQALGWMVEDGAARSNALIALLTHLEADAPAPALVVDVVEHRLDEPTQAALAAYLRRRGSAARPLVLLTRSNVMLDLHDVAPGATIFYCPANHGQPIRVAPFTGAPGYEAVATCLASPEVRARTAGMTATVVA